MVFMIQISHQNTGKKNKQEFNYWRDVLCQNKTFNLKYNIGEVLCSLVSSTISSFDPDPLNPGR